MARYWEWARLCVDLGSFPDQAQDLLQSRVIRLVPEILLLLTANDQYLLHSLFELIRDGETARLKKLTTSGRRRFLPVIPDILAGAAMKLETLAGRLSSPQVKAIITRLASTEDPRLRQLTVFDAVHISGMDPEVVAGALTKLETVSNNLSWNLSAGQVSALVSRICQAPVLGLSELYLYGQDLSLVPPGLLTGAIQRLEVAEFMCKGKMAAEQVTAILTLAKEDRLGRIKRIRIFYIDGRRFVCSSLIKEARLNTKLEWSALISLE